jgi:hypothetical protein
MPDRRHTLSVLFREDSTLTPSSRFCRFLILMKSIWTRLRRDGDEPNFRRFWAVAANRNSSQVAHRVTLAIPST